MRLTVCLRGEILECALHRVHSGEKVGETFSLVSLVAGERLELGSSEVRDPVSTERNTRGLFARIVSHTSVVARCCGRVLNGMSLGFHPGVCGFESRPQYASTSPVRLEA